LPGYVLPAHYDLEGFEEPLPAQYGLYPVLNFVGAIPREGPLPFRRSMTRGSSS